MKKLMLLILLLAIGSFNLIAQKRFFEYEQHHRWESPILIGESDDEKLLFSIGIYEQNSSIPKSHLVLTNKLGNILSIYNDDDGVQRAKGFSFRTAMFSGDSIIAIAPEIISNASNNTFERAVSRAVFDQNLNLISETIEYLDTIDKHVHEINILNNKKSNAYFIVYDLIDSNDNLKLSRHINKYNKYTGDLMKKVTLDSALVGQKVFIQDLRQTIITPNDNIINDFYLRTIYGLCAYLDSNLNHQFNFTYRFKNNNPIKPYDTFAFDGFIYAPEDFKLVLGGVYYYAFNETERPAQELGLGHFRINQDTMFQDPVVFIEDAFHNKETKRIGGQPGNFCFNHDFSKYYFSGSCIDNGWFDEGYQAISLGCYDSSMQLLWTKQYGLTEALYDVGQIQVLKNGDILICGLYKDEINAPQNGFDAYIIRLNEHGEPLSVFNLPNQHSERKLKLYPNPATDVLNYQHNFKGNLTIKMYNAQGQLVAQQAINSLLGAIPVSQLSNGIYHFTVSDGTKQIQSGMWLKQ